MNTVRTSLGVCITRAPRDFNFNFKMTILNSIDLESAEQGEFNGTDA